MANTVQGIFSRSIFAAADGKDAQRRKAAEGFSQVFASILARQMRSAMVGDDHGPMGIGGGSTGDIYGSFLDDAMGKLLAHSPAMKSLNQALARDLGGPASRPTPAGARLIEAIDRSVLASVSHNETAAPVSDTALIPSASTAIANSSDARGPLLLPAAPAAMAPDLPPPSPLEAALKGW